MMLRASSADRCDNRFTRGKPERIPKLEGAGASFVLTVTESRPAGGHGHKTRQGLSEIPQGDPRRPFSRLLNYLDFFTFSKRIF
jgi:hypothetical protein